MAGGTELQVEVVSDVWSDDVSSELLSRLRLATSSVMSTTRAAASLFRAHHLRDGGCLHVRRAVGQQGLMYVGVILILIFGEALGLYGLIVALVLSA